MMHYEPNKENATFRARSYEIDLRVQYGCDGDVLFIFVSMKCSFHCSSEIHCKIHRIRSHFFGPRRISSILMVIRYLSVSFDLHNMSLFGVCSSELEHRCARIDQTFSMKQKVTEQVRLSRFFVVSCYSRNCVCTSWKQRNEMPGATLQTQIIPRKSYTHKRQNTHGSDIAIENGVCNSKSSKIWFRSVDSLTILNC